MKVNLTRYSDEDTMARVDMIFQGELTFPKSVCAKVYRDVISKAPRTVISVHVAPTAANPVNEAGVKRIQATIKAARKAGYDLPEAELAKLADFL